MSEWTPIAIELEGRTYTGRYRLHDKGVTVEYGNRQQFAVLHNSPAETLARIMLRDLIGRR